VGKDNVAQGYEFRSQKIWEEGGKFHVSVTMAARDRTVTLKNHFDTLAKATDWRDKVKHGKYGQSEIKETVKGWTKLE
jgi:hypothetical protein